MPARKIIPLRGAGQMLRAAASMLMERAQLASMAGKTFGGDRDLYKYLGYKRTLVYQDYSERYDRGGIARRIVDAFPMATWRNPPTVVEAGEHKRQTNFERDWAALIERTGLYHYLERLDRIAGVGQYGVMLIGAPGDLASPLGSLTSEKDILYFSIFGEGSATINEYESNTASPRFGLPKTYSLDLQLNGAVTTTVTKVVHYSRVLHAADGLLESEIFGVPRLRPVWNYLDDLDKVVGGSAEAIWRVVDRGIHFNLDPEVEMDAEDQDDLNDEIEEYVHNLKRQIVTHGVESKVLGSETPNPSGAINSYLMLISGTTGIPKRILTGSEQGQLASEQDERNFNARVKERQTSYAMPMLLRPLMARLAVAGALPMPRNRIIAEWPDTSILTEKERADIAARYAQAAANFAKSTSITNDEVREKFFGLPPSGGQNANPEA